MVVAAVAGAGAAATRYDGGVAKKSDIAAERSFSVGLADEIRKLDTRVTTQEEGNRWRDAALKAIADRVGAFVPPPPAKSAP